MENGSCKSYHQHLLHAEFAGQCLLEMSVWWAAPAKWIWVSNIFNYIKVADTDARRTICLEASDVINLPTLARLCWSEKTLRIHAWVALVIGSLQPFSVVENLRVVKHFRHHTIYRITLMKFSQRLTEKVEKKIDHELPSNI